MPFIFFRNCLSSELCKSRLLPILTCIFALSALILTFSPAARSLDVAPRWYCAYTQCPFRRPIFWYLVCCATCLGSQHNSKYHTYPPAYIHTWQTDFHQLFDSGFVPSALSLRLNKVVCMGKSREVTKSRALQWKERDAIWTRVMCVYTFRSEIGPLRSGMGLSRPGIIPSGLSWALSDLPWPPHAWARPFRSWGGSVGHEMGSFRPSLSQTWFFIFCLAVCLLDVLMFVVWMPLPKKRTKFDECSIRGRGFFMGPQKD